jgi:large subunit ribosomal protein L6
MSRIGFKTINIPAGVEVKVDGNLVSVKGPKGQLQEKISDLLEVEIKDGVLEVKRHSDNAEDRSQHGLARTLINNMVIGVTEGFQKRLQLVGVGYKVEKKGKNLVMNIGYSHPVELPDPEGIETTVDGNKVIVSGIDKEKVGQYAAQIREKRPPEPYKGKGIKYDYEVIRRKVGKTGK